MTLEEDLRRSLQLGKRRPPAKLKQEFDMIRARAVKTLVQDLDLAQDLVAEGVALPKTEVKLIIDGTGLYAKVLPLGPERARWLCQHLIDLGANTGPTAAMIRQAVDDLPRLVKARLKKEVAA